MGNVSGALVFSAAIVAVALVMSRQSITNVNNNTLSATQTNTPPPAASGAAAPNPLATLLAFL